MKMDIADSAVRTAGLENVRNQRVNITGNLVAALTTQQYQDGLYAAIRELATNAAESHVQAGKADVPFDVSLTFPDSGEDIKNEDGSTDYDVRHATFAIRDYGLGMSPEFIEDGYYVIGNSTKRDDNSVGGQFGLGAKAVFAATTAARVTSYYNGMKYEYLAGLHENYIRVAKLAEPEPTTEPQGVMIYFSFKTNGAACEEFDTWYKVPLEREEGDEGDQFELLSTKDMTGVRRAITAHEQVLADKKQTPTADEAAKYVENKRTIAEAKPYCCVPDGSTHHNMGRAFLRSLLTVGHPGSTYLSEPRMKVNGLPILVRPWIREYKLDLTIKTERASGEKSDSLSLTARASYYSSDYVATTKEDWATEWNTGVINRYYYLFSIFNPTSDRMILWHNSFYAYAGFGQDSPKQTYYGAKPGAKELNYSAPRMNLTANSHSESSDSRRVLQIYFIPHTLHLSVTPERTGIRHNEVSTKLIQQYDREARQRLYIGLGEGWMRKFEEAKAELHAAAEAAAAAGDERTDRYSRLSLARLAYLGVFRGLWSDMFSPAKEHVVNRYGIQFAVASADEFVLHQAIESTLGKDNFFYRLGTSGMNRNDSVSLIFRSRWESQYKLAQYNGFIPDLTTNRLDWKVWIVGDSEEGIKIRQRERGCSSAIVMLTDDERAPMKLQEALREVGIRVINAVGVRKPKTVKDTSQYRVVLMDSKRNSYGSVTDQISTTTLSIHRLKSESYNVVYATTRGSAGYIQVGDTDLCLTETSLFRDLNDFVFHNKSGCKLAVIRKSDPKKTKQVFEDAGIAPWETVFHDALEDKYSAWRLQLASGIASNYGSCVHTFVNALTAATGSDSPFTWCKFMGWKLERLKRQLWYRWYVRKDLIDRHYSAPSLTDWISKNYAPHVFDHRTMLRINLAKNRDVVSRAFNRRHTHSLPVPNSTDSSFESMFDMMVTYRNGKNKWGHPVGKMPEHELKFVRQLAKLYVEHFSQP